MSKKIKIIFSIYCICIILAFTLVLIFHKKDENEDFYAESLTLNISREITIEKGSNYTLPDNFLIVKPSTMASLVSYTITNKNGDVVTDFNFDGKNIKTDTVGFFYIKFSIPAEKETLTDTLVVHVIAEEDEEISVTQNITTLTVDEIKTINELFHFTCPESATKTITLSNANIYYYELTQKFLPKTAGETEINILITYKSKSYNFNFVFIINGLPQIEQEDDLNSSEDDTSTDTPIDTKSSDYTIQIIGYEDVINLTYEENKTYKLQYLVTNKDGDDVSQDIACNLSNKNVLSIKKIYSPFISFTALNKGTTTLTITSLADNIATKIITINLI